MRKWLRRLVELLAISLVVGAPLIGLWGVGAENIYAPLELADRYAPAASWTAPALEQWWGNPDQSVPGTIVGGAFSVRLFGVELADPLGLLAMVGAGAIPTAAFGVGAAIMLAVHVLLGRWLCGWVCPYGIASRALDPVRRLLDRLGLALHWQPPWQTRWILLVGIGVLPVVGVSILPLVLPYLVLTRSVMAVWFGGGAVVGILAALLLSDLLLWDHGICRNVCPSGALQRAVGRYRVVKLAPIKGVPCERGCHVCAEVCWLGLDPRPGNIPDDCDACGRCTEVCPTDRLDLGWTRIRNTAIASTAVAAVACSGPPPEVIQPTASWTSPFEQVGPNNRVQTQTFLHDHGELVVSTIPSKGGHALRLYLESEPGELWSGPMEIAIHNNAGRTTLAWDGPNSPRSVPRPAQFEATIALGEYARLEVLDGPHRGESFPIRSRSIARLAWLPAGGVLVVWLLGLIARKVGNRTPPV